MLRQEWPSGEPVREVNPAEDAAAKEARVAQLLETGTAVDHIDAERAFHEERDLVSFCERDYGAHLVDLDRVLDDPETEPGYRDHLCFWKAAAETARAAEDPWELEFLASNMLCDLEFGGSPDPAEQTRLASTKRRMDAKIHALVAQIGDERAWQLYDEYRQRLQELLG